MSRRDWPWLIVALCVAALFARPYRVSGGDPGPVLTIDGIALGMTKAQVEMRYGPLHHGSALYPDHEPFTWVTFGRENTVAEIIGPELCLGGKALLKMHGQLPSSLLIGKPTATQYSRLTDGPTTMVWRFQGTLVKVGVNDCFIVGLCLQESLGRDPFKDLNGELFELR